MIIQCRVCRTKYRCEESLLAPAGTWVRCTRCQNVFFQHPPLAAALPAGDTAPAAGGGGEEAPAPETGAAKPVEKKAPEAPPAAREQVELEMLDRDVLTDRGGAPSFPADVDFPGDAFPPGIEAPPVRAKKMRVWMLGMVMLMLVAAAGALFVFPEYGQMAMRELHVLFPGLAPPVAPEATPAAAGPAQVKIVEVKQRFVANPLLGNMRIVEGLARNDATYPLTRIRIRGELVDLAGAFVKESSSYCGNLLNDEELGIMSEEQIFRELAIPQGSDVTNDRIDPQGTIPFMLVFLREPPGVAKTLVMPMAAERLLSP